MIAMVLARVVIRMRIAMVRVRVIGMRMSMVRVRVSVVVMVRVRVSVVLMVCCSPTCPIENAQNPAWAIMAPLSMQ